MLLHSLRLAVTGSGQQRIRREASAASLSAAPPVVCHSPGPDLRGGGFAAEPQGNLPTPCQQRVRRIGDGPDDGGTIGLEIEVAAAVDLDALPASGLAHLKKVSLALCLAGPSSMVSPHSTAAPAASSTSSRDSTA
jgi:hypothetical protein